MDTLSYKTRSVKNAEVKKDWYVVDATNEVLGRLSSKIAKILRGKDKPYFTPHVDCGSNVIIINAEKVRLTGNKASDKKYVRYTGYPGGQLTETIEHLMNHKPVKVIEHAIRGMLPKNRLGNELFRNLYVYAGNEHPHQAQQPIDLNLNTIK